MTARESPRRPLVAGGDLPRCVDNLAGTPLMDLMEPGGMAAQPTAQRTISSDMATSVSVMPRAPASADSKRSGTPAVACLTGNARNAAERSVPAATARLASPGRPTGHC
jgi:hypothetical protein